MKVLDNVRSRFAGILTLECALWRLREAGHNPQHRFGQVEFAAGGTLRTATSAEEGGTW